MQPPVECLATTNVEVCRLDNPWQDCGSVHSRSKQSYGINVEIPHTHSQSLTQTYMVKIDLMAMEHGLLRTQSKGVSRFSFDFFR